MCEVLLQICKVCVSFCEVWKHICEVCLQICEVCFLICKVCLPICKVCLYICEVHLLICEGCHKIWEVCLREKYRESARSVIKSGRSVFAKYTETLHTMYGASLYMKMSVCLFVCKHHFFGPMNFCQNPSNVSFSQSLSRLLASSKHIYRVCFIIHCIVSIALETHIWIKPYLYLQMAISSKNI